MARRHVRRAPLVTQLGPLRHVIEAQLGQSNIAQQFTRRRPASVPQNAYQARATVPIASGYGSGLVDVNGNATVIVGPAGIGIVWFPTMAAIATTSGAADNSTCTVCLSPLTSNLAFTQSQIIGQSYTGGGDSLGLAVPPMWPGTYVQAFWKNGTAGDLATLTVYGDMEVLI